VGEAKLRCPIVETNIDHNSVTREWIAHNEWLASRCVPPQDIKCSIAGKTLGAVVVLKNLQVETLTLASS